MKIYYQLSEPMYNGGLGVLPVSIKLIYTPTKIPLYSLSLLYEKIKETNCLDLIITGPITDEVSIEGLSWLTPKLISEGYYITYHTHITDLLPNIIFTRYVLDASLHILRRNKELSELRGNTIILLQDGTIPELKMSRKLLLSANIKAKVMFDTNLIEGGVVLHEGIYDLYPYMENNYGNGNVNTSN